LAEKLGIKRILDRGGNRRALNPSAKFQFGTSHSANFFLLNVASTATILPPMAKFPSNLTAVAVIPLCVGKLEEWECYYAALAGSIHGFTACGDVTSGGITLA
jgi:hypothetical protein